MFFFRPRFIRDEINITDHLFFAIVDRSGAPKNFLKYHNLTTSQLAKKFVVYQQLMSNAKESSKTAAEGEVAIQPPYAVTLEDLSLKTILRHIIDNYSNYIFYYIIDSTALVNGAELSQVIEKLYFKSDFLIGHPMQPSLQQASSGRQHRRHNGCDPTKGFLVHQHLLQVISNQSASSAVECVSELGGGISYVAATAHAYTEAVPSSSSTAITRPIVIYGLTSELEYQAAAERILKDFFINFVLEPRNAQIFLYV